MTEQHRIQPRDWAVHTISTPGEAQRGSLRGPKQPLVPLEQSLSEISGPEFDAASVVPLEADLTKNAVKNGEPLGERIIVLGKVLDEAGRPVRKAMVELWQANAAGRYAHLNDHHDAPMDPNFIGVGRCVTDDEGAYRFITVKPGAYPARDFWRPQHLHLSICGGSFIDRLVTQLYFPGDPLQQSDRIFNALNDPAARERLVAKLSMQDTVDHWALAYRFDIVLRGASATPFEN